MKTEAQKKANREYQKNRHENLKSNGICRECGRAPAVEGQTLCKECVAKRVERDKNRRENLKSNGICAKCGRAPAVEGRLFCEECAAKQNERGKNRRENWKSNGICAECGRVPAVEGQTRCEECAKRHMNRVRFVKYGLTRDEYDTMSEAQGGLCMICGRPFSEFAKGACVDHNHETGKVRGLLCSNCNCGIGQLHNKTLLNNAINYLELYSTQSP